jgi:hypothetical protein
MKKCKVCLEEKDLLQFYKDRSRNDSYARECKECCNSRKTKYARENIEKVLAYKRENAKKHVIKKSEYTKKRYLENRDEFLRKSREKYTLNREKIRKRQNELQKTPEKREKAKARQRKYYRKNKKSIDKFFKKWITENREKARAHYAISDAIRRKKLIRPGQCERCNIKCKPDAHHFDYSKKLDVHWLCKICHAKETFNKDLFEQPISEASNPDTL